MQLNWNVHAELVTEESAEAGDAEERWTELANVSFRDAIGFALNHVSNWQTSSSNSGPGDWFSTISPVENRDHYELGHNVYFSLHPPRSITPSSWKRVERLLDALVY